METRISKDECFMGIAKLLARRSTCLTRQVGCVLLDKEGHILSTGYNGIPAGVDHCTTKLCPRIGTQGKNLDLCTAIHSETNAVPIAEG